jgi:AcrR family transcriptional regulator
MPKIQRATLADQRSWRRSQLIEAATAIALETGGSSISVAAVAARAGLSRTSVYEYFASSADLISDLIIEELSLFAKHLEDEVSGIQDPRQVIERWICESLRYVADGRHLLAKSLSATDLPKDRGAEIAMAHRKLLAPLHASLASLEVKDLSQALSLLQAATDVATKRIESARVDSQYDAEAEIARTTAFCIAGISALV